MAHLTSDHIDYIRKDLAYRGIVVEGIDEELTDHICDGVEAELQKGGRFIDAYHKILRSFGHNNGLRHTQIEILQSKNQTAKLMIRNYFTIAFRSLNKHRFYSFINIAGLAIGVASCLVIVLFVINEMGYDKHHVQASRIYRINSEIKFNGNHWNLAVAPAPLAGTLLQDYPEIESAVRFRQRGSHLLRVNGAAESFKEQKCIWVDSTFFEIFTVPVVAGDPGTALKEPNTIAISSSLANKYFPGGSALGQSLILDNDLNCTVTAVFSDMPDNSHFRYDVLISLSTLEEAKSTTFLSNNFNTYLLLKEGADPKALESKFPAFVYKYIGPQAAAALGGDFTMEKFIQSGNKIEFTLMPLLDIHLHGALTGEMRANGDITYVYLFAAIALFILGIACINFMNLSTARSANRAKEVGVRKVLGSLRLHLIRQFLLESIMLSAGAFVLAVGLAYLFIPIFNDLSLKQLVLPFDNPFFYVLLLIFALIIGVIAGLYPSFFLSAFKPINVLKGQLSLGMKSGFIRSALVVFQFVISIFLVVGTLTVNRQLNYIQSKKIGFEKDQILVVNDAYALGDKMQSFKEEVLKNSFITNGSITGFLPVEGTWRNDNSFWKKGGEPTQENMVSLQNWSVDNDYIETLGMKIVMGRNFSKDIPSDSSAVIINQAAVKRFNLEPDPIGMEITTFANLSGGGTPDPSQTRSWRIIGVVEDFHFESMRQDIRALGLFLGSSPGNVIFSFQAKNAQDVIQAVEKSWKSLAPGQPFQFSFLDEDFGKMYASEQRLGRTFGTFAGLAIFIACLGLFALTSFTAEQRTKEIGIRKVLGASVGSIVILLSREFGKLILIAFVLAAPVAWLAVDWWLKNYTYKVEIGVGIYILAGAFAFVIAWVTMGYQSIKAARSNPVNSLRSE